MKGIGVTVLVALFTVMAGCDSGGTGSAMNEDPDWVGGWVLVGAEGGANVPDDNPRYWELDTDGLRILNSRVCESRTFDVLEREGSVVTVRAPEGGEKTYALTVSEGELRADIRESPSNVEEGATIYGESVSDIDNASGCEE